MRRATSISAIDSAIKRRGYVTAAGIARVMIDQMSRDVGVAANPLVGSLRRLAIALDRLPLRIVDRAKRLDPDQQRLFDALVGMRIVTRD